jgi:hypothetical protein
MITEHDGPRLPVKNEYAVVGKHDSVVVIRGQVAAGHATGLIELAEQRGEVLGFGVECRG